MTHEWKDKDGMPLAKLTVDDEVGITIELCAEENAKHANEIEEMQTLAMYPPKNEENIKGIQQADGWTRYQFSKGKNWEFAKKDIEATFKFWIDGQTNLTE